MLDRYVDQVRLIVDVLPHIAREDVFALKGGTAINLFYRDMPRLSVDIDLTYLPVKDRDASLRHIDETFSRIMETISGRGPRYRQRCQPYAGNWSIWRSSSAAIPKSMRHSGSRSKSCLDNRSRQLFE